LIIVLGALIALAITACSESTSTEPDQPQSNSADPTATFSPADPTATWVAFEPELEQMPADALGRQSGAVTAVTETAVAKGSTPTPIVSATLEPATTQEPLPQRAIATGPENRIVFEDGRGSIFTVNPDGSEIETIGDGSDIGVRFRYTFPVWSLEGGTVSFSSYIIFEGTVSQNVLHRADADGNGSVVTLAIDPTSQSGIGPGEPHFSAWSPKGDRIALTTSGEFGIGTMLLGSYSGESTGRLTARRFSCTRTPTCT
jgi:hypothetical protein